MLLVQHDQTQGAERQKNGRTGANDHERPLCLQAVAPGADPFPFRATTVIFEHSSTKSTPTAIHQLGNETNFRSQQQNMPACCQLFSSKLEVDLGLARTGDPPKQHTPTIGLLVKGIDRNLLLIGEGSRSFGRRNQVQRQGAWLRISGETQLTNKMLSAHQSLQDS